LSLDTNSATEATKHLWVSRHTHSQSNSNVPQQERMENDIIILARESTEGPEISYS